MQVNAILHACVVGLVAFIRLTSSSSATSFLLASCSTLVAVAPLGAATVEAKRSFDIPRGDAEKTLRLFAAVSGHSLVYVTDKVRGETTNPVRGDYAPVEALGRMLAGTKLEAAQDTATGALVVSRKRTNKPTPTTVKPRSLTDPEPAPRTPLSKSRALVAAIAGWLAFGPGSSAQSSATTSQDDADFLALSPFEVSATSDVGYQARETIAGGRLRTELRDVPSQVDVMTQEFISDLGINSLEDALRYSLNIESENDFYNPIGIPGTLTGNPYSPEGSTRARGLGRASTSVGFFETTVPIDSYNTERLSFVGGPNAILFGNGLAGGSIDTSFKRAQLDRDAYSTTLQFDSDHGYRALVDFNKVLIRNLFAVRFNGLKQDQDLGRSPSFDRQERAFYSGSFKPFKNLRVRGYYESAELRKQPVRPTLVQDKVTPYLNTLSPEARARFLSTYDPSVLRGFDNSAINSSPQGTNANAVNTALIAQGFAPVGQTAIATRYGMNNPVAVSGGAALPIPIMSWNNTAQTSNGPGSFHGDTVDWSFSDGTVFPAHINIFGNGLQSINRNRIYGGIVEFQPTKNLFVEYGFNRESYNLKFVDFLPQNNAELLIDLNRYLPVTVASGPLPTRIPNPNFGRYYVTSNVNTGESENQRADHRLTATYELDFTQNKGWTRWLGAHRLLALWTSQVNQRFEQVRGGGGAGRVISDNDFTTTSPDIINSSRTIQIRHYIGSPTAHTGGAPYLNLPYDPWNPGVVGRDAGGRPVILASNELPWGRNNPVSNGRKETEGRMLSLQSAVLQGRIVGNLGIRSDRNTYSPWLPNNLQPRFDGATGQYVIPTAPIPSNSALSNAPFMPWQDFQELGLDRMIQHSAVQHETPTSKLKSVVIHPTRWLSFFYNQSTSAYAAEFSRTNLDGTPTALDDGKGKDYGFSLSFFDGRLSLRVNRYETIRVGTTSSYRDQSGPGQRSLRDSLYHVEKTYLLANPGYAPVGPSKYWQDQVNQQSHTITANTNFTGTSYPVAVLREASDVNSDKFAHGTEVVLSANPLGGLFISLRGAKNSTLENNIGGIWFDYIRERVKVWETAAHVPMYAIPGQPSTLRDFFRDVILPSMSYVHRMNGVPNPQERRYRLNVTARYSFQGHALKGLFIGGNYNWRSRSILGFYTRPANKEDLITTFDDLGVGSFQVPDFDQMIYGRSLISIDAFAGYRKRIFKGKCEWRVQLNIRNLLNDQELIPQRAFGFSGPSGNQHILTNFNLPDPRRFILTNTISF